MRAIARVRRSSPFVVMSKRPSHSRNPPPPDHVAEKPAPVQNEDVGSGDGIFQVRREPERAADRVLNRYSIRSGRSRSRRVICIEQRGDLDAMTRQGLAPTSRGVRRARLASAEVLLVVNDPDPNLRMSNPPPLAANDYGMRLGSAAVAGSMDRPLTRDRPTDRLVTLHTWES